MNKRFKFAHKTGKVFKDKRGYLLKILDKGFSSCVEIFSKKGSSLLFSMKCTISDGDCLFQLL